MPSACRICSGPLALRHRGRDAPITAAELSPTCHEPGAYADLYACERCGTVQQPALPSGTALVDLYRDMEDGAYLVEEAGRRATARRLLKLVGEHAPPPGRLLEVGCGHGLLLDEARRLGWDVRGLEPAAGARAHARDALGLDVSDATLADLRPGVDGGLDAVLLVDVLEHLDDPLGALRDCRALLADGGVLLVVTPDPSSPTARIVGARWWGYLPAHTFLLPRRTLRRVVEDAGFATLADRGLKRTFTLRNWLAGLAERSPRLAGLLERRRGGALLGLPVTLSLGDERVLLARRAAHAPAAAPALAPAAAAGATP
ncbi:MAG TPA: class I SAM-dependent methyltransferase [Solirubrobacteraceae bacterium]|jgi:SAM-dependent methyltransferase